MRNNTRIKVNILALAIFFVGTPACARTTLEEQFQGIENCEIGNIFLDPVTNKPSGNYFVENKLQPCSIGEAASYCVNDTFYGLNVWQVSIPYRGPFSVHAIYFKEDVSTAADALKNKIDLKISSKKRKPTLIADPKKHGSSVIYCDQYSE